VNRLIVWYVCMICSKILYSIYAHEYSFNILYFNVNLEVINIYVEKICSLNMVDLFRIIYVVLHCDYYFKRLFNLTITIL